MIEIVWDENFKRQYIKWSRKNPELVEVFRKRLELFEANPFSSSLRTHSLSGRLQNYWSFRINFSQRLIFKFADIKRNKAILVDLGTHDEVY